MSPWQPLHGVQEMFYISRTWTYIDGLLQERRNSSALAMELHLSCINPLIYHQVMHWIYCSLPLSHGYRYTVYWKTKTRDGSVANLSIHPDVLLSTKHCHVILTKPIMTLSWFDSHLLSCNAMMTCYARVCFSLLLSVSHQQQNYHEYN